MEIYLKVLNYFNKINVLIVIMLILTKLIITFYAIALIEIFNFPVFHLV